MVISSGNDPVLHVSVSSITTVICRTVPSSDEPGVSQCWVLYRCKLLALEGLQSRQRGRKRNRECCHLSSVPEAVQHKAQDQFKSY